MSEMIRTVTGDIDSSGLGYCHAHEHLMVSAGGAYESFDRNLVIDDEDRSLEELNAFFAAGGRACVDAQPVGAGRSCRALRSISEKSGVHIIASTGFHMRRFYPGSSRIFTLDEEEAEKLFTHELTEGMYAGQDPAYDRESTGIRAGLIKTALGRPEEWDAYRRLFDGAAAAAAAVGAPVMIHTEKGSDVIACLDHLENRGVDLNRVVICHLDRTCSDLRVHKEAAERGAFLDYDTVARYKYHDDETECRMIRELLDAGYESNILLALDCTAARLKSYGGTPGLAFIRERFEDIAEGYGIPGECFTKFMIENPARAFHFGKAETDRKKAGDV